MSRPYKVDSGPHPESREGDIPYYAKWSDGSYYLVYNSRNGYRIRLTYGPMFGGDLKIEKEIISE